VIQKIYINSCLQELLSPIIKIKNTPYLHELHLDLPRRSVMKGESPTKITAKPPNLYVGLAFYFNHCIEMDTKPCEMNIIYKINKKSETDSSYKYLNRIILYKFS